MIACEFCDLFHQPPTLRAGEKAYCSRCGGLLAKASRSPIEGTLALALAAALLLVLANIFPFLRFALEGQVQENRIVTGVIGLWHQRNDRVVSRELRETQESSSREHHGRRQEGLDDIGHGIRASGEFGR